MQDAGQFVLPTTRVTPQPAVIAPFFSVTTAGRDTMRSVLPPALFDALDRLADQVRIEVVNPLLAAESAAGLRLVFEREYRQFGFFYGSSTLMILGHLEPRAERVAPLLQQSLEGQQSLVRTHGPRWMGQDATLHLLMSFASMARLARVVAEGSPPDATFRFDEELEGAVVSYAMASTAALAGLSALAAGETAVVRLENLSILAHWSRAYATRAQHLAKLAGLLAPCPERVFTCEEDQDERELAEAGIEDYAALLAVEDRR